MRFAAVIPAGLAACSPFAVTPPARTFAFDSPSVPAVGHGDVQLDAASSTQGVFSPTVDSTGGQLRTSLAPNTAIVASAEEMTVEDSGSTPLDHHAYAGRIGAVIASDGHHVALTFGAGAGTAAAAGKWGSADLGGVVSGANRWIRPMLGVSIGYSQPFSRRPFTVSDGSDPPQPVVLELPTNVIFRIDFGLELGPPELAVILGVSAVRFFMVEPDVVSGDGDPSSSEPFMTAGVAARVAL
ncbi:MAG TPA: hypothetical protein VMJ10_32160 [Kofleriaceae bacterium]|nr:hypothetical protein [Kofleriaceae bacterium]